MCKSTFCECHIHQQALGAPTRHTALNEWLDDARKQRGIDGYAMVSKHLREMLDKERQERLDATSDHKQERNDMQKRHEQKMIDLEKRHEERIIALESKYERRIAELERRNDELNICIQLTLADKILQLKELLERPRNSSSSMKQLECGSD